MSHRRIERPTFAETPRLPSGGTYHGPVIEMAECYSTIEPGNAAAGSWLPVAYDRYDEPNYVTLGTPVNVREVYDPFYWLCAAPGERFFVIRDSYRNVWMPLGEFGLFRHASLGATLAPGGSAAGSSVALFDHNGTEIDSLSATVYSGHDLGDTVPSASVVPVRFIASERKWYATCPYYDESP